jgi:hypothetical protein
MKYAVRALLAIWVAVALCSCESLPSSDSFDPAVFVPSRYGGGFVSSQNEAIYHTYMGWRGQLAGDDGNVAKMSAFYSPVR